MANKNKKTLIGYEYHRGNGDGSISVLKFKTKESADAYAEAEENSEYFEGPTDAGPWPVYLEEYRDRSWEEDH